MSRTKCRSGEEHTRPKEQPVRRPQAGQNHSGTEVSSSLHFPPMHCTLAWASGAFQIHRLPPVLICSCAPPFLQLTLISLGHHCRSPRLHFLGRLAPRPPDAHQLCSVLRKCACLCPTWVLSALPSPSYLGGKMSTGTALVQHRNTPCTTLDERGLNKPYPFFSSRPF